MQGRGADRTRGQIVPASELYGKRIAGMRDVPVIIKQRQWI